MQLSEHKIQSQVHQHLTERKQSKLKLDEAQKSEIQQKQNIINSQKSLDDFLNRQNTIVEQQ